MVRNADNPHDKRTRVLRLLAARMADEGRWREALKINLTIISETNAGADDYNRLGESYRKLEKFTEAVESYQEAFRLDPNNLIAKNHLTQLGRKVVSEGLTKNLANIYPMESTTNHEQRTSKTKYSLGDHVRLKVTGLTGIIIKILPNNQYQLFIKEDEEPIVSEDAIEPVAATTGFVTPQEFLRDLLIFKMRRPLSDTLYSYSMSRTNFEAYQFKPALKFLSNPYGKILIADEVGLGKTIEACIVYLELKARMRGDLPRVLVVCPSGLRTKWQSELSARFNEQFEIMDSNLIQQFFNKYRESGSATRLRGICSIEGLRREELRTQITELGIQFDLVIIDEAHHMHNPEAQNFNLGEILSEHADSLIMLTATPVHLKSDDLFYLLNILEPGEFENKEVFDSLLEPNRLLNKAIDALCENPTNLQKALDYIYMCPPHIKQNPFWGESIDLIRNMDSSGFSEKRQQLAKAIRNLSELNTFSLIFNRTRRKEVKAGVIRKAIVLNISLTDQEQKIYSEALRFARVRAKYRRGYVSILGLIQIERQLASSLGAFKEIIADFRSKKPVEAAIEESSTELESSSLLPKEELDAVIGHILSLYEELGEIDSKYDKFYDELSRLLETEPSIKVIVYSFFRRTLGYLHRRLRRAGHKVEVIHGGIGMMERQTIIDRFKNDNELHILLSSEVGAEGLDMQFCNTIINYDLPWNPMLVEQRIGRIDRYGQKSDKVRIISLFLKGTIEERILQRLYDRIGIFVESIGSLEPILGDIVTSLSRDIISTELTPEQESKKADDFLEMLEFKKLELDNFEKHRLELMGPDTSFVNQVEDNINSGRFVSSKEIKAMVSLYLTKECSRTNLKEGDSTKDIWRLEPDELLLDKLRTFLSNKANHSGREDWAFIEKMQTSVMPRGRYFTTAPKGLSVTFNSQSALERPLLEFINVWHPLVRLAFGCFNTASLSNHQTRMLKLNLRDKITGKMGTFYFFIFYLATKSIVHTHELVPTVVDKKGRIDEELSSSFLKIINDHLFEDSSVSEVELNLELLCTFEKRALLFMSELGKLKEAATKQRNESLIGIRREALEKTFEVKKRRAQFRLGKATDSRIIRMHEGEIKNLESKLRSSIDELENKRQVEVRYEPIACGLLEL